MRATSVIAEFIVKSRWEDCPVAAVDAARRAILDCVGVMLAGSAEPAARIIQQIAESEGGAPLATIVGTRRRTGAVWAALANGTAAHALDFDDTNFAMLGHPSAPVLAAALAAGELALAAGHAARSGVLSALLAREGFTASEQAIEGPQGYLAVLSAGKREESALEQLGAPWKILTTGVAVKPYPSCACTHSIIDSALELQRTLRVAPDDIARVTIGVHPTVPRILIHSNPKSGLEAKFSGEFSAAAALCEGKVGMQT